MKICASAGKGKYRITAEVKSIGEDIIITVWGGTTPHIGSVVVSVPRPSLKNNRLRSATSSVFNFIGHKDEVVARFFSETIAAALNCNTVVTAGIHIENMSKNDLQKILKNAQKVMITVLGKTGERIQ